MNQHIQVLCELPCKEETFATLYEDNVACIALLKRGYIKGDRMKHISRKFFFAHNLQKQGAIMSNKFV